MITENSQKRFFHAMFDGFIEAPASCDEHHLNSRYLPGAARARLDEQTMVFTRLCRAIFVMVLSRIMKLIHHVFINPIN